MINVHEIPITIADVFIKLQSPISVVELGIEKRFGPFLGKSDDPVSAVSLCWAEWEDSLVIDGELIYNPGSIWQMYCAGNGYLASINCPERYAAASAKGVLRTNAAWDILTLTEQRTDAPWESLLNTIAGRMLLLNRILFIDGLLLHAAGIDDNGNGIVFVGHSGTGKSTQARLWGSVPGVIVMNGDCIAVRSCANDAVCYSTPWGGIDNIIGNHKAPLSALILLEQAQKNDIKRLSPSAAAPQLLARALLPYWDRALMQRAMANLNMLLERVPVYRLRCRPEPAVVSLVRSVL